MELEINKLTNAVPAQQQPERQFEMNENRKTAEEVHAAEKSLRQKQLEKLEQQKELNEKIDVESTLKKILKMSSYFNRKLKYTVDRDSDMVIVKVIDRETDKVIKEIPPEELKRLYSKMKEAIGHLIDEQI